MIGFAGLSFGLPWLLLGLLALPAIWWLLRVTPPAPRRVMFPPFRLLLGLSAPQETPARTPLWLLLLRILAAALIIVAFAEPTIGQRGKALGQGPLVLFIDNDWAAAQQWKNRDAALSQALADASSAGRAVAIVSTASAAAPVVSLLAAGEAERAARALVPQSYEPDRLRAARAVAAMRFAARPEIVWLSDDIDRSDAAKVAATLSAVGDLTILGDPSAATPLALTADRNDPTGFAVDIARADEAGERSGTVEALGEHDEGLAAAAFRFAPGASVTTAHITLPLEVRNETRRIAVNGVDSAGTLRLLGTSARRLAVGIVTASNLETQQPLLAGVFYLKRALAPYADVHDGSIAEEIARNDSVLFLADYGALTKDDHDRVANFVANGGVLIRFAGGRMTADVDDLVPVKLRVGGRYLGGALAWSEPRSWPPSPIRARSAASPFRRK